MIDALPPLAHQYLPVLQAEVRQHWPDAPLKSAFAGQVEQETCITLKHRKCWSPYAELKTSREYGFGLGQITITLKFDNFKEAKKLSPTLKDWSWDNRYNAVYQLRTLVLTNRFNYGKFGFATKPTERMAFTLAAYNGGLGGVLSDRRVCVATVGCEPTRWFGHVEKTSRKAKVAVSGYGKSFFEINRSYVMSILCVRRFKYKAAFPDFSDLGCKSDTPSIYPSWRIHGSIPL